MAGSGQGQNASAAGPLNDTGGSATLQQRELLTGHLYWPTLRIRAESVGQYIYAKTATNIDFRNPSHKLEVRDWMLGSPIADV